MRTVEDIAETFGNSTHLQELLGAQAPEHRGEKGRGLDSGSHFFLPQNRPRIRPIPRSQGRISSTHIQPVKVTDIGRQVNIDARHRPRRLLHLLRQRLSDKRRDQLLIFLIAHAHEQMSETVL